MVYLMYKLITVLNVIQCSTCLKKDTPDFEIFSKDPPRIFLILGICFLFSTVVYFVIHKYKLPISHLVIVMTFGGLFGILIKKSNFFALEFQILDTPPHNFLLIYFPIMMFKMVMTLDQYAFLKSAVQIGLMATVGYILQACFVGFVMLLVLDDIEWSVKPGLVYGLIVSNIYPGEVLQMLYHMGPLNKHIINLLQGETILTTFVFNVLLISMHFLDAIDNTKNYLLWLLKFMGLAIVVGYISGLIIQFLVKRFRKDTVNILVLCFIFPIFMTYMCRFYIDVNFLVVVFLITWMLSKTHISTINKKNIIDFAELMLHIMDTFISFIIGAHAMAYTLLSSTSMDYAFGLLTYIATKIGRLLTLLLLLPILRRTGYGFTSRNFLVMFLGALKPPFIYFNAVGTSTNEYIADIGWELIFHTFIVIYLTMLIDMPLLALLSKLTGLYVIPKSFRVNMKNCLKQLMEKREATMRVLKHDRFLCDANWPLVLSTTFIKSPYSDANDDSEDDDDFSVLQKKLLCPDCRTDMKREPTRREVDEMVKEARIRILKTQKASYLRQFESGMLTKKGLSVLERSVETATDSKDKRLDLSMLYKLFSQKGKYYYIRRWLLKIMSKFGRYRTAVPRRPCRRVAYIVVNNAIFQVVVGLIILLNVTLMHLLAHRVLHELRDFQIFIVIKSAFLIVYVSECILTILSHSVFYFKQGLKIYFRSILNIADFIFIIIDSFDLVLKIVYYFHHISNYNRIVIANNYLRWIRWLGVYRVIQFVLWGIVKFCESQIETNLSMAYDLGKAFILADDEILEKLESLVDNEKVRNIIRTGLESTKLQMSRELGLLQENRAWMSITLKSKQGLRTTLNTMRDAVNELKELGWADFNEYNKLMESLEERYLHVSGIRRIDPNPPKILFREVSWLEGDEESADFLLEYAEMKTFEAEDVLFSEDEFVQGMYIVVTGIVKMMYEPDSESLKMLEDYGQLPLFDSILSSRFDKKFKDYFIAGNSFGELAVFTGRKIGARYIANTSVRLYYLEKDIVLRASEINDDFVSGLEPRMWKMSCLKLTLAILSEVATYRFVSEDKMKLLVSRGIVPKLEFFNSFIITELVETIVLIEGSVIDFHSKTCYKAPCHIPRYVKRLQFTHALGTGSNLTRMFIIPTSGADGYEVMLEQEEFAEFNSSMSFQTPFDTIRALTYQKKKHRSDFEMNIRNFSNKAHHKSTVPVVTNAAGRKSALDRLTPFKHSKSTLIFASTRSDIASRCEYALTPSPSVKSIVKDKDVVASEPEEKTSKTSSVQNGSSEKIKSKSAISSKGSLPLRSHREKIKAERSEKISRTQSDRRDEMYNRIERASLTSLKSAKSKKFKVAGSDGPRVFDKRRFSMINKEELRKSMALFRPPTDRPSTLEINKSRSITPQITSVSSTGTPQTHHVSDIIEPRSVSQGKGSGQSREIFRSSAVKSSILSRVRDSKAFEGFSRLESDEMLPGANLAKKRSTESANRRVSVDTQGTHTSGKSQVSQVTLKAFKNRLTLKPPSKTKVQPVIAVDDDSPSIGSAGSLSVDSDTILRNPEHQDDNTSKDTALSAVRDDKKPAATSKLQSAKEIEKDVEEGDKTNKAISFARQVGTIPSKSKGSKSDHHKKKQ